MREAVREADRVKGRKTGAPLKVHTSRPPHAAKRTCDESSSMFIFRENHSSAQDQRPYPRTYAQGAARRPKKGAWDAAQTPNSERSSERLGTQKQTRNHWNDDGFDNLGQPHLFPLHLVPSRRRRDSPTRAHVVRQRAFRAISSE